MPIQPKPIFDKYLKDPSFADSYFRDDLIKSTDRILNVNFNGVYHRFSVERLTVREFNSHAYRQFKHIKTFSNQSFRIVLYLQGRNSVYINGELTDLPENTLFLFGPGEQVSIT
ncbi:MAG: hypothetical protein PQJ58_04680, partial [Spirochaetales bacterium]|nr:hypothetical protein [Spirochaetales bacterium]